MPKRTKKLPDNVNTPLDLESADALVFIQRQLNYTHKTDAARRAILKYAESLGWHTPQQAAQS